mmetsp:Transcript_4355/g.18542  ORF Transcript_4355/g.18542 Transcript_4355/m.18542 type:complete len:360 (+) Transcript_4355:817-1896(+)
MLMQSSGERGAARDGAASGVGSAAVVGLEQAGVQVAQRVDALEGVPLVAFAEAAAAGQTLPRRPVVVPVPALTGRRADERRTDPAEIRLRAKSGLRLGGLRVGPPRARVALARARGAQRLDHAGRLVLTEKHLASRLHGRRLELLRLRASIGHRHIRHPLVSLVRSASREEAHLSVMARRAIGRVARRLGARARDAHAESLVAGELVHRAPARLRARLAERARLRVGEGVRARHRAVHEVVHARGRRLGRARGGLDDIPEPEKTRRKRRRAGGRARLLLERKRVRAFGVAALAHRDARGGLGGRAPGKREPTRDRGEVRARRGRRAVHRVRVRVRAEPRVERGDGDARPPAGAQPPERL